MASKSNNILLLSLSGIGNVLMQSPVFEALKKRCPQCRITTWVAPRGTKELMDNNPYVDEVIEAPIRGSLPDYIRIIRLLRKKNFDVGIVLHPGQLVKSASLLFAAGIPVRIGATYPYLGNQESDFLLTDAVRREEGLHDIGQNIKLLEPLEIRKKGEGKITYAITIPKRNVNEAKKLIDELKITTDKMLTGFHAGSAPDFTWKRWPLENFAAVGKKLTEQRDVHILLFGGGGERQRNKELQHMIGSNCTCISTTLLTTAALMQHCNFVLSNDSGLMHLAAASGVKTFGLFGPTDERKVGPRGKDSHVIRAPGTVPVYDTISNYTPSQQSHASMLAITPEYALEMVQNLEAVT